MRVLPRLHIFYGWWIVLAGTVGMVLQGGLYFYGFSVFFVPLVNEFGWTRAAISGVFSLSRLESGLAGPVEGYLTDRFGPRKLMFLGIVLMGLGFVLLSRVDSIVLFYIVFIFMVALGTSLGTQTPVATAIGNWFIRKRGLAFGVYHVGVGVGGLVVPLLAWLITQTGWRTAAVVIGVVVWVCGIPLSMIMRHKPEQYGYLPDGDTVARSESTPSHAREAGKASLSEMDFTPVEALKTSAFWLLSFAFALRITATNGVALHLIPYLVDVGFTPEMAAMLLGAVGVMSILGRGGIGWLGDVLDKRYVLAVSHGVIALGILLLMGVQSLWSAALFLIVFTPPYGGAIPLSFAIRGEYFGRKAFGTISGFFGIVQMLGTVGGPLLAGYIFDVTGSYHLAFLLFIVICVLSLVLVLLARRPVKAAGVAGCQASSVG